VRVRVVRVNLEQAKIDFVLVEQDTKTKAARTDDPFSEDDEEQDLMPHVGVIATNARNKKKGKR
jgi:hypothetical protein